MAPQEQEDVTVHLKLELKGIGATLRPDDGATVVETLVPGGAADLDGRIKIGDQIVAVAQDDGSSPVETQDMKLKDVVTKHIKKDLIVSATRAGNIPGTHRVGFDGPADQILLEHTARSREGFAAGAIVAAEGIGGKCGGFAFSAILAEITGQGQFT